MKLTHDELEFLSAWALEEWEPACYQMPSHRLQLAHEVSGAQLIVFIKAWAEGEGKNDQDILGVAVNPRPRWPWSTTRISMPALPKPAGGAPVGGRHLPRGYHPLAIECRPVGLR